MEGPDHKASLEPEQLKAMIDGIRNVELALGDGLKGPRPSEVKNKAIARKSLVAEKVITKQSLKSKTLNINVKDHIDLDFLNENLYWTYVYGADANGVQHIRQFFKRIKR